MRIENAKLILRKHCRIWVSEDYVWHEMLTLGQKWESSGSMRINTLSVSMVYWVAIASTCARISCEICLGR